MGRQRSVGIVEQRLLRRDRDGLQTEYLCEGAIGYLATGFYGKGPIAIRDIAHGLYAGSPHGSVGMFDRPCALLLARLLSARAHAPGKSGEATTGRDRSAQMR